MRGRIAPADGYVAGTKRHYRHDIWATFRRELMHRSTAQALLMPSAEGTEVDVALAAGFREENLHLVDHNPAIAALLKRRYPKATCYGVDIVRAGRRIAKVNRLAIANLDLCGTTDGAAGDAIASFIATGVMSPKSWIGLTVLRGRERQFSAIAGVGRSVQPVLETVAAQEMAVMRRGLGDVSIGDQGRLVWLSCLLQNQHDPQTGLERFFPEIIRCNSYLSNAGNQTMLWAIFALRDPETKIAHESRKLSPWRASVVRLVMLDMWRPWDGTLDVTPTVREQVARLDRDWQWTAQVLNNARTYRTKLSEIERTCPDWRRCWTGRQQ